jgi:hypothetical protein
MKRSVIVLGIVGVLTLGTAPAGAVKVIHKVVATHIALSATKASDGTITARGVFTSSNPRCLSSKRTKPFSSGQYSNFGSVLLYGASLPGDHTGQDGNGGPPGNGRLAPVSPAGRSPWIWEAVWAGSAPIGVENRHNKSLPYTYKSTVAGASAVELGGYLGSVNRLNVLAPYEVTYQQGKTVVKLVCPKVSEQRIISF